MADLLQKSDIKTMSKDLKELKNPQSPSVKQEVKTDFGNKPAQPTPPQPPQVKAEKAAVERNTFMEDLEKWVSEN